MKTQQQDFAEFYRSAADECLRTVVVSIGDQDTAQELVDEAFARGVVVLEHREQASRPQGVGGPHGTERRHLPLAAPAPGSIRT